MLWDKEKGRRKIMPPVITFLVLAIIICTMGITRVAVKTDRMNTDKQSNVSSVTGTDSVYDHRYEIVSMLISNSETMSSLSKDENNTYIIYDYFLRDRLCNPDIELNNTQLKELKEKIIEIYNIMKLEGVKDFTKMSFDGRAVAIHLAGQIYEICGMKLETDINGNIERISDLTGNAIYIQSGKPTHYSFHIYTFIITVSIIIMLLCLILFIGRKSQLFGKDGVNNGFNEKRYA